MRSVLFVLVLLPLILQNVAAMKCNFCGEENGLAKKRGLDLKYLHEHSLKKRSAGDGAFRGHPKTKAEVWARNFNTDTGLYDQSTSLIKLLNKIALKYLHKCHPYVLYDTFVEKSELSILQNLFQTFPLSFYHGIINEKFQLQNSELFERSTEQICHSYILFLSDPLKTRDIIGPQTVNNVVVVARSSQWKLRDFLSSAQSSDIVNLLVIGESLTADPKRERPYVLYTHKLYADGLGANSPVVLTSWIRGGLTRPHINLFPRKFANGFAGHRFLIAAVNQPPFIFRSKKMDYSGTMNVIWEGIEHRIMRTLGERLNFSFEIVEPRRTDLLGSGEAVREEVQLRHSDIGMAGAYITFERLKEIDMSVGHSRDCAKFITLASKALPKYRAIMGPFQWPVWLALTTVYLVAIFPLTFSDKLTLKHLIGNLSEVENMFWYVFGTFTNSLSFSGTNSWSNSNKVSTRLLIGFYWIFTIIITSCYTGSIIAFVTLPSFPDTVDSVNDLLGLFFRVATLDKGGWETWFANSTHEATAKLYKKMEYVANIEEGIGNVTKSFFWNYAFLGSQSQLEYLVQSNFSTGMIGKRSALHLSEDCFAPFQVGFAFPKNSVYADRINELIIRLQQSGLIEKIRNEVSWKMQRSATGELLQASSSGSLKELIREERQLTTADTEGMFLLMGAGYLIASLALISEVIGGFTNKCRAIIKRSKKSVVSAMSSRRSSEISTADMHQHLEKKAKLAEQVEDLKRHKSRFPGLSELNLTRETLKELYGGYREKNSNIIFQNGEIMFESEAISEDSSSLGFDALQQEIEMAQRVESERNLRFQAVVHCNPNISHCEDAQNGNATPEYSFENIHMLTSIREQGESVEKVCAEPSEDEFGESVKLGVEKRTFNPFDN